jgi:uncharacterized protein YodC (DUF2158 family)
MTLKKITIEDLKMNESKPIKDTKVKLKAGGPDMMIEKYIWDDFTEGESSERVTCVWFDGKKLMRGDFNVGSLELV